MRLGTTSYIYPADILPNVRLLAGKVEDIELVLFEVDDGFNNLPDQVTISELRRIASANGMTYTVHLPVDLRLAARDNSRSIAKALRVIDRTASLEPYAYVIHLEGEVQGTVGPEHELTGAVRAIDTLAAVCPWPALLSVENLESQPPELLDAILGVAPVSCCLDVGHLWKRGDDPVSSLNRRLPRTRVIHIHGVGSRDHQRLSLIPEERLDDVTRVLADRFSGVVTLEVFNESDFLDSMDALRRSMDRVAGNKKPGPRSSG
ncbi:MAG: sugar phosphate isomerase/epimerase [Desulfomonile sp.]|nr:sugar phosphate isomerase/epimerase [Desulfomonile sp.]